MAELQNKCPLCSKVNPVTEWVCEDCGAQLPFSGLPTTSAQRQSETPVPRKGTKDTVSPNVAVPLFVGLGILSGVAHYFSPQPKKVRLREGFSQLLGGSKETIPVGISEGVILFLLFAIILCKKLIPHGLRCLGGSRGEEIKSQKSHQKRWFDAVVAGIAGTMFTLFLYAFGLPWWIVMMALCFTVLFCWIEWMF